MAHQFKIEDDIPIPSRERGSRYPVHELQVGQSFLVPDGKKSVAAGAMATARKNHGKKFMVREVDGGARIWRTK